MSTAIVTNKNMLRIPCRLATVLEAKVESLKLINKLEELKELGKGHLGLASNQIGGKIQVCVVSKGRKYLTFINPVILDKSKEVTKYEKCISYPKECFEVTRFNKLKVSFVTLEGMRIIKTFRRKIARRIEHEIDHLNGIVPTDEQFKAGAEFLRSIERT